MSKFKDALVRTVRTFVQAFLGIYLAGVGLSPNFSELGSATVVDAALGGGIVAALTLVMNLLEDATGTTALK